MAAAAAPSRPVVDPLASPTNRPAAAVRGAAAAVATTLMAESWPDAAVAVAVAVAIEFAVAQVDCLRVCR